MSFSRKREREISSSRYTGAGVIAVIVNNIVSAFEEESEFCVMVIK